MPRAKYYWTKARLAGMFSAFPAGMCLVVLALVGILYAQDNLTPYSVSVSGYTRRDGTHVSAYSRRPPGSVQHDQPYAVLNFVGFVVFVASGYVAGRSGWLFFVARPEKLLPPLASAPQPPLPPTKPANPTVAARARRDWQCKTCKAIIRRGEFYRYPPSRHAGTVRSRYCELCSQRLKAERRMYPQRSREYQAALVQHGLMVAKLRAEQFRAVYGVDPPPVRKQPSDPEGLA